MTLLHRSAACLAGAAVALSTLAAAPSYAAVGSAPAVSPSAASPATTPAMTSVPDAGRRPYRDYVALGDSYTAGPLIPRWRLDPAGCFRSTNNYPAYLASYLRVSTYTDVSCSGARSRDMFEPQATTIGSQDGGTNPAQLDALRRTTDLVTLGIGGNDFGLFGSVLSTCPRVAASDPTGAPCREAFRKNGRNTAYAKARAVRRHVARVVRAVHRRAPHAKVVVVGYLRILPTSGTCAAVPFATGDYAFADRVERTLNRSLRRAARANRATFVNLYPASRGHDACAGPDAWVNGAQPDLLRAAAFHPFKAGMVGIADAIYARLSGKRPPARGPFDSGAPTLKESRTDRAAPAR